MLAARGLLYLGANVNIDISASAPVSGQAAAANGGNGAPGGYGAPGMLKLHGSVVDVAKGANRPTVRADHSSGFAAEVNGKITFVTNMSQYALSFQVPNMSNSATQIGVAQNAPVLTEANTYLGGIAAPLIPQLSGGPATHGYLTGVFFNSPTVFATPPQSVVKGVQLIRLTGNASVYSGFDQIVLRNTNDVDLDKVAIGLSLIHISEPTRPY